MDIVFPRLMFEVFFFFSLIFAGRFLSLGLFPFIMLSPQKHFSLTEFLNRVLQLNRESLRASMEVTGTPE